jgi:hypothetical protein
MGESEKAAQEARMSKIAWFFAKACGAGLISYATPRFLVAAGVPLDSWIVAMGGSLHLTREAALWAATIVLGLLLFLADRLWRARSLHIHQKRPHLRDLQRTAPPPEAPGHRMPPIEEIRDLVMGSRDRYIESDAIGDAFRRMANQPPKPPKRDSPLGAGIAYACLGTWEGTHELERLIKEEEATATLKEFEQKAADGDLTVWGRDRDDDGHGLWHTIHDRVPPSHWRTHWVEPASLMGRARTADRPPNEDNERFYDLMVSKREFEREFPRGKAGPTTVKRPSPALPLADRAQIGTPGAVVVGIDGAESRIIIDIQNFGRSPAYNVTYQAKAGWFERQPEHAPPYGHEGSFGITDAGHGQNLTLILTRPLGSSEIREFVRGGPGIYALVQVRYTDASGVQRNRRMAYYLDPQSHRGPHTWPMSICPTGNDELEEIMEDKVGPAVVHNVTSHGQQGGITAHTVNVSRKPPRALGESEKASLLQTVPRDKPITILVPIGDQEALHLASQIHSFLRGAGQRFQHDLVMVTPFSGPQTGIGLYPHGDGFDLIVGTNE